MPRVSDILIPLWCLYVTFMTIAAWFGPGVNSFEDWMMSMIAWYIMIIIPFAIRGNS